ncbi:MAG: MoaD/ThiS family protein [Candidatus Heimdallarchaeota archaeon]|nr:MAG: MoaD/ThiS family protein [Candidatus Heimdallarchaeota archaeon]
MIVHLQFLGSLQYDLKQQSLPFQISSERSLREIVSEIIQDPQFKELKSFFSESLETKRSLLVFINQQEISVLNGMNTKVKGEDIITFIPVIHGGAF